MSGKYENEGLYQRHRPKSFADLIGQEAAVAVLESKLSKRPTAFPSAVLLSGPSGCGKTTAAYILKERLQCAEGDWLANNSARERGIDFVRNLERGMLAHPSGGKVRICLLDEAHKLTPDAMEALLKSLEEVKNTYKFLLCTTDAGKIKKAVGAAMFTRLVEVPFVPVDEKLLEGLVTKVAKAEGVTLPKGVSAEIAERAGGSPRQALTLLEAVIDLKNPEQVREVLDATASSAPGRSLAQLLFDQRGLSWTDIAAAIRLVTEAESARRGVMGYADAVALKNAPGSPSWARAMLVLTHFQYNTYDTGRVGLTLAAGKVLQALTAHQSHKKTG
jgi:DNA polymerase III gamma/tau subunit